MLCESCKKNEASVHVTKIVNGVKQEFDLCEKCARDFGELNFTGQIDLPTPFTFQSILSGLMDYINLSSDKSQKAFDIICPKCGTTYSEFKKNGLVGCSECYNSFKSTLLPIIKRVQGNIEHNGKVPVKAGKDIIEKRRILKLKEELQEAVAKEEYERAAEIRDIIKGIQKNEQGGNKSA